MYTDKPFNPMVMGQSYGAAAAVGLGAAAGMVGELQKRESELPTELTKLAKALEFAENSLRELHSQLDGKVIRPSMPEPTTGCSQAGSPGPSTVYAQEINRYAHQAHRMGEMTQDIMRRLEI